jgi:hypothetical protein
VAQSVRVLRRKQGKGAARSSGVFPPLTLLLTGRHDISLGQCVSAAAPAHAHAFSVQELGKLLVMLHRNASASSLAALMKQFDLNQNNKIDFAEFVLLMQSLPESDEALVEHAVNAQSPASATALQSVETQTALASVNTQAQLLSIAISHSTVVAGAQNGLIFIWDLEASAPLFGSCATTLTQSHPGRLFESRRRRLSRSANTRVLCQPLTVRIGIIRRRCLCLGGRYPRLHLPPPALGARIISYLLEEPDLCSRWQLRSACAGLEDV